MWIDRREALGLVGAASLTTIATPHIARASAGRVVIIGGGFGGATAAIRLKVRSPELSVTLIERRETYVACPLGNAWLGGLFDYAALEQRYDALRQRWGIDVLKSEASEIDPERRQVRLTGGDALSYDALILAPGIAIRWDALDGYDERAAMSAPHAWLDGTEVRRLKAELDALPDGGLFVITAPDNPYRCPTAPYERASMAASYFKTAKPAAKVLILDAKDSFPIDLRFRSAWPELYGEMIEWVGRSADGRIVRVDALAREVETEFGERIRADVLNVVPPQKAGAIAERAGVVDATGWAPVHHETFESTLVPGVYVIGDASLATPMPKSVSSAAIQAEIAAEAVAARLAGQEPTPPGSFAGACYALIAGDYGVSSVGLYRVVDGFIADISTESGISPPHGGPVFRAHEAEYAFASFHAATASAFGTAVPE